MVDLTNFLSKYINFSKQELEIIQSKFYPKILEKNTYFLKQGVVCQEVALILQGTLVLSQTLDSGSDIILDFFVSGNLISDYYSYLKNTPSTTNIKVLNSTSLLVIKKKEINELLKTIPNFQIFGRHLAEQSFLRLAEKGKQNGLPPSERYAWLLHNKPEIIEQFPQYMIASYLGISPEWLSKLRAKK